MRKWLVAAGLGLAGLVATDAGSKSKLEYEQLKVRDLIEIMSEYEVKRVVIPPADVPNAGYSVQFGFTDSKNKDIIINSMVTKDLQRLAVIHESLHAYYDSKGIDSSDEFLMRKHACQAYKEIYEANCPRFDLNVAYLINPEYIKAMKH